MIARTFHSIDFAAVPGTCCGTSKTASTVSPKPLAPSCSCCTMTTTSEWVVLVVLSPSVSVVSCL